MKNAVLRGEVQRLDYIDLAKGIGALLVVMDHIQYADITEGITKLINGFCMPMFFWISGYLYKKPSSYMAYAKRKARSLLIPWLSFGVFYLFISLLISGKNAFISGAIGLFFKVVRDVPIELALWFLPVLFFVCMAYSLIDLRISPNWVKYVIFLLITMVGCEWTKYFHYLPFGISTTLPCIGFFAFGAWFRKRIDEKMREFMSVHKALSVFVSLVCIIVAGYLIMLNDRISVRMGEYGIPVLSFTNAMLFTVSLDAILLYICKYCNCKPIMNTIINPLIWLGKASIIVMAVNHPMIYISLFILNALGWTTTYTPSIYLLHYLLTMVFIIIIIWIFKLTPLKRIVGWK